MTSHPKDLSDELIDAMAEEPKICKQLHLPVQSGSDRVLKLMNRKYTRAAYMELVKNGAIADLMEAGTIVKTVVMRT